ncbi:MAG: hypothetical protein QOG03_1518, partial [Actinomycetota bacterium]|nr:hypothetical protein [Actinomycetota bacterium]
GNRFTNVHVGIQRGKEPIDYVPGDADEARWRFDATVKEGKVGLDLGGPYIQGRPGDRFIYLSWLQVSDGFAGMFRRAKLMLKPAAPTIAEAVAAGKMLRAEVALTMADGSPRCAAVVPPVITWSAV